MTADRPARIVFFGTPEVAVPALDALVRADDLDVVAVVTNPDRPRGRSGRPQPPPVKQAASHHGLRVLQPARPVEMITALRELAPAACAIVAYGALLPTAVLEAGGAGFVNLHFSLLPRWRGAAPVQHALRAGDTESGVTTFVLDAGMDTGPVLRRLPVPVGPDVTAGELLEQLALLGAGVLADSIRDLLDGVEPEPQSSAGATLAPKITPDDVRIEWTGSSRSIVDLVRSANPVPGAHTIFRGERLKVWRAAASLDDTTGDAPAGTVVAADPAGLLVATGDGGVRLLEVQPAGKGRVAGGDFANGYQPAGEQLGGP